jgi:hypothetical protein
MDFPHTKGNLFPRRGGNFKESILEDGGGNDFPLNII